MKRSTTALLVIFLLLLAAAVLILWPESGKEASYELVERFFKVDSSRITAMGIRSREADISFEKVGGEWFIVHPIEYRADQNSVLQLLSQTREIEVKSLISENPERQETFEVDTSGILLVYSEAGGPSDSLRIGKTSPSVADRYVRKTGSIRVYLASGVKGWLLTRKVKDWRDKTIVDVPRESIERLSVGLEDDSFTFERREGTWFLGEDSTRGSVVDGLLSSLSPLRAEDFVDSSVALPERPTLGLEIESPDPVSVRFYRNPADSSRYWVTTSGSPQVYQVRDWLVRRFQKPRSEFLE